MYCQRLITLWILFLCLAQGIHAANDQQNYYRTFWNPQYHGKMLDYCLQDKKHCGEPVANQYCRAMGYDKSNQSTIAHNVGVTRYFATCKECKAWNCNGFKRITCVAKHLHKPPRSYYFRARQFVYPRFNHYRIDWCYTPGKGCGERAAFSFCRRMGYSKTQHFEKESRVVATRALGNQQLCFGDQCNGFKSITCYR